MLLDRFGIRRVGRASTLLWSVASFAAAISPGLGVFFAARFLLGVAESPTFPANAKAVGLWFPKSERTLAVAITDAAAKFASALGVPFLGLLLLHFGWRFTFAATGLVSLLYFLLFFMIYRNPTEDRQLSPEEFNYISEGNCLPGTDAGGSLVVASLFAATAEGLWIGARLGCLQLQLLPTSELAAQLSFDCTSYGSAAFRSLHQRSVDVRYADRSIRGWMARGRAH
jgi:MFS family permease